MTKRSDGIPLHVEAAKQESHLKKLVSLSSYLLGSGVIMAPSRKVNSSGDVVETDSSSDSSSSLLSGGYHVDVFGFNLDVRQFLVTLALAYLMLGSQGSEFELILHFEVWMQF